jgi:ribonuclease HII
MSIRSEAIVKGDDKVPSISAASILAKTARDAALMVLHDAYPHYGFDRHRVITMHTRCFACTACRQCTCRSYVRSRPCWRASIKRPSWWRRRRRN